MAEAKIYTGSAEADRKGQHCLVTPVSESVFSAKFEDGFTALVFDHEVREYTIADDLARQSSFYADNGR